MVSLQTRTEWLSVLSAITALLAPVLVTISDLDPILFLIYLLAVSLGFLAVVFMTHWRGVTLTLAVGTSIFSGIYVSIAPLSRPISHGFL